MKRLNASRKYGSRRDPGKILWLIVLRLPVARISWAYVRLCLIVTSVVGPTCGVWQTQAGAC